MQNTHMAQWDKAMIEAYLLAYPQLKRQMEILATDLEEMLAPRAVSFQKGGAARPRIGKEAVKRDKRPLARVSGSTAPPVLMPQLIWEQGEDGPALPRGRNGGGYADPTAAKAIQRVEIREQLERDGDYQRMKQFVMAVDRVMLHLQEGQEFGTARQREDAMLMEQLLVERYFKNRLSDTGIYVKLGIPDRTYFRWKREILGLVKLSLQSLEEKWQFCGSKSEERRVIIVP